MAETRTHDPKDRDDLDRALRKALGDPVRPFAAGETHQPKQDAAEGEPKTTPPISTLGSFTFHSTPSTDGS